jgi:hypothetical protein
MSTLMAQIRRGLSLGAVAWVLTGSVLGEVAIPAEPAPTDSSPQQAQDMAVQNDNVRSIFTNSKSCVIPCKFVLNSLLIPVPTPDKSFAYLIFDTGAAVPMISDSFARKMHIRGGTHFPAMGIGQNISDGSVSGGITFSLSGLTFQNAHWAILPNIKFDATYGLPVVGILGMDLLKGFVIRIDYAGQKIEFIKPSNFQPPGADAVCLPLSMADQGPMVEATVKSESSASQGRFLFDTGNNGSLDLSGLFQDHHPDLKFRKLTQSGANGVGGTLIISEAICPELVLGGISVLNPLVDLDQSVQGVQAEIDGGIGNEIWRRFDVTFDVPDKKLYLKKSARFSDPFSYVTAGMHVQASGDAYEKLTVHEILPGSPGEKAGFETGDVLVALDELKGAPLIMANVYPLLHRTGTYRFVVRRGEKTLSLTLELKDPTNG